MLWVSVHCFSVPLTVIVGMLLELDDVPVRGLTHPSLPHPTPLDTDIVCIFYEHRASFKPAEVT